VRLLIADTFATAAYTIAIQSSWVATPATVALEIISGLRAADIGDADSALLPAGGFPTMHESHLIVPAVALIADGQGAIAMRTPVRPDEVEATPVRMLETSETALVLARATLRPFYGIEVTRWITEAGDPDTAQAEVVIVEGAEALRDPEGGFNEDLCRAWFILNNQPVVTHVLAIPRELPLPESQDVTSFLVQARSEGLDRRKEWRSDHAERQGVSSSRAGAFWAAQRYELRPEDQTALIALLQRGGGLPRPLPSGMLFASDLS
jgi:hypothetical protein